MMWLKDWEKTALRNYYVWYLAGGGAPVLVDTGVAPRLAEEKKLTGYVSPAKVLSRINVRAEDVRHIVLTHLHWDHANGLSLFPNATFYVQKKEYQFWAEDPVAKRPPFRHVSDQETLKILKFLDGTGHLKLLEGDQIILPGVECLFAPGHTVGLQAVAVTTAKGTAILGSDCAHIFENYREDWPSALIVDMVAWMKTYEKLRRRVSSPEILFPGHDTRMLDNYPEIAEDITQLV